MTTYHDSEHGDIPQDMVRLGLGYIHARYPAVPYDQAMSTVAAALVDVQARQVSAEGDWAFLLCVDHHLPPHLGTTQPHADDRHLLP